MKVAYLAPEFLPPWGGVGIYSVGLIKELSKYPDLDIHVLTPRRGKAYPKKRILDYFDNRITLHQLTTARDTFFYNLKFQMALLARFNELHKRYRFDLVHSANLVHMPDIFLMIKGHRIPHIVTAHTTIRGQVQGFLQSKKGFFKMSPSEKGSILAYPVISLLEKAYLKRTEHMLTVSRRFVEIFRNQYKYRGSLKPIHNGIDLDIFDHEKTEASHLSKDRHPIVLYAARLTLQKGISDFAVAMRKVLLQTDRVHFVICGSGEPGVLQQFLKEQRIPKDKVTFLGFVDNEKLPPVYKGSDIFVLPSYYENFPISLLEAMSMKCACIATDVGAVDEIVVNNKNGYLIRPGKPDVLAGHILDLLSHPDKRKRFARQGHDMVAANFSSRVMAAKTREVYMDILK